MTDTTKPNSTDRRAHARRSDEGLPRSCGRQAEQAEDVTPAETHPILAAASAQLAEYFAGDRVEFDLPLDLIGTDFQKAAWLALADVPYGETSSYGEQAERIGRTGAFLPSALPTARTPFRSCCRHRIVGADGSLTGFAGGLAMKQRLLALEQDPHRPAI